MIQSVIHSEAKVQKQLPLEFLGIPGSVGLRFPQAG